MRSIFVGGIGTDVGKTVVSASLLQAYGCDYWKPIQAGEPKDSSTIRELVQNPEAKVHEEEFFLSKPMSPHAAASIDGVRIELDNFQLPKTRSELLLIEGVGGLLVPLSDSELAIDIPKKFGSEVILVSRHYLGSINHTLLSCEALKNRGIPLIGIVFIGDENKDTERAILGFTDAKFLARLPERKAVTRDTILEFSKLIKGIIA